MKSSMLVLGMLGVLASAAGHAQSGADVLKAKGCLNCHETDKKKIGPAYKDLAAKYKDDKDAESRLIARLKEGKDHPKIAASGAELKAAVAHVLSMK